MHTSLSSNFVISSANGEKIILDPANSVLCDRFRRFTQNLFYFESMCTPDALVNNLSLSSSESLNGADTVTLPKQYTDQ